MAKSRRHDTIVSVPVPPPDPRPYVPQITLPGGRETAFLALHDNVLGYGMHWVENQHYPHRRDREWCLGCKLGQSIRWTGFLGVVSLNTCNRFVLSLPAAAFRESGHFRDRSDAGMLAGLVFTGYRFGASRSKTNPAVIEIVEPQPVAPKMHPFPLRGALSRYWRMETLDVLDEAKRPEDLVAKQAEEFIRFAERCARAGQPIKGVKP